MNHPTPNHSDEPKKLPVGIVYWAILAATVFLLLLTVLCLLIGLALGLESESSTGLPSGGKPPVTDQGGANQPSGKPNQPSSGNNKVLYPTTETRNSYLFGTEADAASISGISSQHAILVSLDSYTAVAQKNADARIYPASMFKVMSLLVACERVTSLSEKVTVTAEVAQYAQDTGGSGVGLKVGEELTIKDLLYLTSYYSDTIAVISLAQHLAGDEATFVGWMNQKAQALGLTNTSFANCTGLHDPNNYTTCREMATIMAYALENALCRQLLTSYTGYAIENNIRKAEDKTSLMIYSGWYSQRFKDNPKVNKNVTVKGGKTGYEDIPSSTFVTYATDAAGKEYICVVVGRSMDPTNQAKVTNLQSTNDTKAIYKTYVK